MAAPHYVIGVDGGTESLRAGLFNVDGACTPRWLCPTSGRGPALDPGRAVPCCHMPASRPSRTLLWSWGPGASTTQMVAVAD